MGGYVLLTAYLVQRGSAESKPLDEQDRPDDDPEHARPRTRPAGRDARVARRCSTATASRSRCSLFFVLSFVGHLLGGTAALQRGAGAAERRAADQRLEFLGTPDFWFQSMQNWQSEFLAVGALIVLSIVLRQHGSPESKPVTAPHAQTGG